MTPGAGYAYTVFFALSDGEATSNLIATTVYLDVVVPDPPVDETAPEIVGLPADIATTTTGASTVVTWPIPRQRMTSTRPRRSAARRPAARPSTSARRPSPARRPMRPATAPLPRSTSRHARGADPCRHVGQAAGRRRAGPQWTGRPEHPAEADGDGCRPRAGPGRYRGALAARPVARGLHDDIHGHRDACGGSVRLERWHLAARPRHERAGRRLHAAGRPRRRRDVATAIVELAADGPSSTKAKT